jgi:hypothetical protein
MPRPSTLSYAVAIHSTIPTFGSKRSKVYSHPPRFLPWPPRLRLSTSRSAGTVHSRTDANVSCSEWAKTDPRIGKWSLLVFRRNFQNKTRQGKGKGKVVRTTSRQVAHAGPTTSCLIVDLNICTFQSRLGLRAERKLRVGRCLCAATRRASWHWITNYLEGQRLHHRRYYHVFGAIDQCSSASRQRGT